MTKLFSLLTIAALTFQGIALALPASTNGTATNGNKVSLAASSQPAGVMLFHQGYGGEGKTVACIAHQFNVCYKIDRSTGGVSSITYSSRDWGAKSFTFYRRSDCSEYYTRDSFDAISVPDMREMSFDSGDQKYWLDDRINSYKVADFRTTNERVAYHPNPETPTSPNCQDV